MFVSRGSLVTKTPIDISRGSSYFPYMPPMSTNGWPSAYSGIYARHLWVNVVVSKRARATARLPLPVYRHDDQDRPRDETHPMAQLLSNPNPNMSGFDLWLWTSSTFDIYGDTFWLKRRSGRRVVGLFPLHPSSMSYDDGAWHFDNGRLKLDNIPDADLVRFKNFHPDSLVRGLSPIEPLRSTLENEWSARTATSSFWRRGARPGTALVHPTNLSEPAAERIKAQYDAIASGAANTGATVVLEEGMQPHKLELTAEEAQYIETRKLNREEVCAAYDVPPPVVHILDRATFSNITEQMRSMYRDTMAPHLKAFESTIERDLRRAEWPDDDVYAEFLMDEVLRGDFETRQDALNKASHMTIAEKRKIENLPFIEGTDRIFLNTATMPLDAIDAQAAAIAAGAARTAPAPADDAPLADVIPLTLARSVLGRLSWQRSLDQVDAEQIVTGMPAKHAAIVRRAVASERKSGGSVASLRDRLRSLSVKVPEVPHEERVRRTLAGFFRRQPDLDRDQWDPALAADLHDVALQVTEIMGRDTIDGAGFDPDLYSVAATVEFLRAVSERLASNINLTTAAQLETAEDPAEVYAKAEESRAEGISVGITTLLGGFAAVEAGRRVRESQGVEPVKRWITGPNARPSHASMNGEEVGIDDVFSNGMTWPGEGDDSDIGCNCSVEVVFP